MKAALQSFWQYAVDAMLKTVQWDEGRCDGCLICYEVCPVGCFRPNPVTKKVYPPDQSHCVACSACVLQCPEGALTLER